MTSVGNICRVHQEQCQICYMKSSVHYLCCSSLVVDHVHINIVLAIAEYERIIGLDMGKCWSMSVTVLTSPNSNIS